MKNGQFIIRQASRKKGPFLPDAAADIATAFGRASVTRISRSVARRCASVGLCAGGLYACGKEGPIGTATRGRTGPATHTPKSSASLSWPSRPYRASGQSSCGKRLQPHTRGARHRRLESRHTAAARTRDHGCASRGATAALGPRTDFRAAACSAAALAPAEAVVPAAVGGEP